MTPIWRIQNGQGPSWKYAQARIDSDTNYQVPSTCSVEFFNYRIYFFIQNFIFSRLYLKAFGVIPELVDMLQLMILHSLKEIAQVILHFNT